MTTTNELQDTTDHDTVMCWLQEREMNDTKLGAARRVMARLVEMNTAISRMKDEVQGAFPDIDAEKVDRLVRKYIDPEGRTPGV